MQEDVGSAPGAWCMVYGAIVIVRENVDSVEVGGELSASSLSNMYLHFTTYCLFCINF